MTSSSLPEFAARAAIALDRAERRRDMLEHLADWGMSLSKDICTRSMDSPYHPELKHDPGRAFGAASRAVRLTLAMEERVEAYILALCNGVAPVPAPFVADTPAGPRGEAREPARQSVEREIGDVDEPRELREREGERLIEREDFGELLTGDFNACVDVIRVELGIKIPAPLDGDERLNDVDRDGDAGVTRNAGSESRFPTLDLAALRLGPPHEGEGGRKTEPIFRSVRTFNNPR